MGGEGGSHVKGPWSMVRKEGVRCGLATAAGGAVAVRGRPVRVWSIVRRVGRGGRRSDGVVVLVSRHHQIWVRGATLVRRRRAAAVVRGCTGGGRVQSSGVGRGRTVVGGGRGAAKDLERVFRRRQRRSPISSSTAGLKRGNRL